MKRIHEKEMIRFAKNPDRTRVWWRAVESRQWSASYNPSWEKGYLYITDDKWAEIRKGDADGIIIQFRNQYNGKWQATIEEIIDYDRDDVDVDAYRLKPKYPLYMREKSSGIIVKFHDETKGVVVCGIDQPQKGTGFTWHCFVPHTREDWWEPSTEPVYEYQWIFKITKNNYDMTKTYYQTKEDFKKNTSIQFENIMEKYEPSKRLVE